MSIRSHLLPYMKAIGLYRPARAVAIAVGNARAKVNEAIDTALAPCRERYSTFRADFEVWRNIPARAAYIARYYRRRIQPAWSLLFSSRELSNFTYDLTDRGKIHIAHAVSIAAGCHPDQARGWIDELANDKLLRSLIVDYVRDSSGRYVTDARAEYGRRLGWYALARASHPRLVIETGVDKGLGSLVLCAALRRNAAEGFPGRYIGTDINPSAGELLRSPYADFGTIVYGDSLASLATIEGPIDLFVNDSDHSADYERREYELIDSKLAPSAIVVGDNAHVTDELANFAARTKRCFIAVRELPKDHWYLGATMGIAFEFRRAL
jgi:predicted O-methyltransferase YrrM